MIFGFLDILGKRRDQEIAPTEKPNALTETPKNA